MELQPTVEVVGSTARAAALLDPTRLRLLAELAEPDSAAGVARRLGLPRQRVNYHLRELERHGLVELIEERRKGNCVERMIRASARWYLVGADALGPIGIPATLCPPADGTAAVLQIDVRFASAADRGAFAEELAHEVAKLAGEYHDEGAAGGREFRLLVASYPAPSGDGEIGR